MIRAAPIRNDELGTGSLPVAGMGLVQSLSDSKRQLLAVTLTAFALSLIFAPHISLTAFFLARQDRWLLLLGTLLLAAASVRLGGRRTLRVPTVPALVTGASLLVLACLAGHFLLLAGYDMSRDEQMATFDAAVFARGHLVEELPPFWRTKAHALNTLFMYPAAERAAWISSYLPLNAAFRALFGAIATPALTGPVMTALGLISLWGCARRIWPRDRELPVVALLLYLGSGQVVVTGMTAYAMPAHLALNLVWLWLFLRRQLWADIVALAVGFVAVGLHQPLLHPIFAGPLLCLLVLERDWRRTTLFAAGYAAIGVFWLWWPDWIWTLTQSGASAPQPDDVGFLGRLATTLSDSASGRPVNMLSNMLRFFAWQHVLLLPLLLLAGQAVRRDRVAGALAAGMLLTIFVMALILPYQGHGFGYRYLHGLIGNAVLVACFGWQALGEARGKWRTLLVRTSAGCLGLVLPVQAWMAHDFYAPAAAASKRIDALHADFVVIGEDDVPFSRDLIRNPPRLERRPVRLLRSALGAPEIEAICAMRPKVVLIGPGFLQQIERYYGMGSPDQASRANRRLAPLLAEAGCVVRATA